MYADYSSLFNFALYLILFLGLSRVVFARHFEGRGGKSITIAVGLLMATALAITENRTGFELITVFGPVSVALFIGMIGVVLFTLLISFGARKSTAAAATYLVLYLSFTGIATTYHQYLQNRLPILTAILAVGLIIAIIILIRNVSAGKKESLKEKVWLPAKKSFNEIKNKRQAAHDKFETLDTKKMGREKALEKNIIRQEKTATKDTKKIIKTLDRLKTHLHNPDKRGEIIADLSRLTYNDSDLIKILSELKWKHDKIKNYDLRVYHALREQYSGKDLQEQQNLMREEIDDDLRKLQIEKRVELLDSAVRKTVNSFEDYLKLAVNHIKAGEHGTAETLINKSISEMKRTEQLFSEIEHLDKKLLHVGKRMISTAKTLKKKAA